MLFVCVLLGWPEALARADDGASASDWKRRGDDAMDAGRAAEALDAYRHAITIAPSPALEYNLGRALLAVGDFAGALDAFEHYETTASDDLRRKTHRLADVLSELRSKVATLTIAAVDESGTGARVSLRGSPVGSLPIAPFRLSPGSAELRIERDGFEPFVARLELEPGRGERVDVTLRPSRPMANLELVARPGLARVSIDGEPRGGTPLVSKLPAGPHRVVVSAPEHGTRAFSLTLSANESRHLDIQLAPEKPTSPSIASRWWFWTGAGALALGAAGIAIAATSERAPSQGSLGTFRVP